jgi:hypothetical protein
MGKGSERLVWRALNAPSGAGFLGGVGAEAHGVGLLSDGSRLGRICGSGDSLLGCRLW